MKFWKNNKIDLEHEMQSQEIFLDWTNSEERKSWLEGQRLDRILPIFLTRRYGTYEPKDFDGIFEYVLQKEQAIADERVEVLNEA